MNTYLTTHIPGIGGVIKETPEDFRVAEVPLYLPSGSGEHTYVEIEKRGITTMEAVRRLSRSVGVAERDIGYAGLKDAVGVTRQFLSLPRVAPERLLGMELPGLQVLSAERHGNKLRLGHLAGNRFCLVIRQVGPEAAGQAREALTVLAQRGVPNRFGVQRYGAQGNSHLLGLALLRRDWQQAVATLVGDPAAVRDEGWRQAIEAFRRGALAECLALLPSFCRSEREVVERLMRRPDDWEGALRAVPPRLKNLWFSALQSSLFDQVLAARLDRLDMVLAGDVAWKHDNGACFLVEDAEREAERAASFAISPTGPLFGPRMLRPVGEPGAMEDEVLRTAGLDHGEFAEPGASRLEGGRRPLRVPLGEWCLETCAGGLVVEFTLPPGAYATAVLGEVMKGGFDGQDASSC